MICKYNNGTCLVGGLCDKAGKCHALPSERATPETACQPRSLALANCCLWVPAGKLLELARRYEKEVELLNRFRADFDQYDGMANALAQVSLDLRLLAGDATERQPTDNDQDKPRRERSNET